MRTLAGFVDEQKRIMAMEAPLTWEQMCEVIPALEALRRRVAAHPEVHWIEWKPLLKALVGYSALRHTQSAAADWLLTSDAYDIALLNAINLADVEVPAEPGPALEPGWI